MSDLSAEPGAGLTRRYQLLLSCYPWEHRRVYEEEMLGVLLAGARPGQRFPAPADTADLLTSGLRLRLHTALGGLAEESWRDAAAVVGLLAAILALVVQVRTALLLAILDSAGIGAVPREDWLAIGGWALVTSAALVGRPRLAAGTAWVVASARAVLAGYTYGGLPALRVVATVVLAFLVAAVLTVPATPGRGRTALGRWRLLATPIICGATQLPAFLSDGALIWGGRQLSRIPYLDGTWLLLSWHESTFPLGLCGLVVVALTLPAPVRRRVLALLVVPLWIYAGMFAVEHGSGAVTTVASAAGAGGMVLLMIGTPVLVFAVAVAMLRRRERSLRLIELGRAADRQRAARA